jgi:hypothetical protein
MVSLMSDSRVVFLIWFVAIATVLAIFLIFVEISIKRKREKFRAKKREVTIVDKLKISVARALDVRKKLDVVGATAKKYFSEEYGMEYKLDYSERARKFREKGKVLEAEFCEEMFEAYYSNNKLTSFRIEKLLNKFSDIYEHKHHQKEVVGDKESGYGFMARFDKKFDDIWYFIMKKIGLYSLAKNEKIRREIRAARRENWELLRWVRKAIHMGYDKVKLFNLLDDGKRSKKDVKKILKLYDKEAEKVVKDDNYLKTKPGIAQKILSEEKDKLKDAEVLAT